MARLVEEYIKQDVEIMMYIDNNKMIGGGQIETANSKIVIMEPEILKSRSFDYCLIAVENYQEIRKQCLQELLIPEIKI